MRQAATSPQFGRLKEDTGVVRNKTGEYQRGQHEALHDLRGVRVIADDIRVATLQKMQWQIMTRTSQLYFRELGKTI